LRAVSLCRVSAVSGSIPLSHAQQAVSASAPSISAWAGRLIGCVTRHSRIDAKAIAANAWLQKPISACMTQSLSIWPT
jgi:hypothetical protein